MARRRITTSRWPLPPCRALPLPPPPAIEAEFPGARVLAFGHLGDGNLHFNVRAPAGPDAAAWLARHGAAISGPGL